MPAQVRVGLQRLPVGAGYFALDFDGMVTVKGEAASVGFGQLVPV